MYMFVTSVAVSVWGLFFVMETADLSRNQNDETFTALRLRNTYKCKKNSMHYKTKRKF